jgi:hypothetical protein
MKDESLNMIIQFVSITQFLCQQRWVLESLY